MMKKNKLIFSQSNWIAHTRLYGLSLNRLQKYLDMEKKVKRSTLWSYEIIAPNSNNRIVYHCPDAYVMKHICEEVAKCMLLAFPSCSYHLVKIIHTEVSK